MTWSVLFDDVELTAAEVAQLAKQARPLVRSRHGWVEVDRARPRAGGRRARRARRRTASSPAPRSCATASASTAPGSRVDVRGHSWATDILAHAAEASTAPVTRPAGFNGELRSYQAEALAWIGFLERADLGGCLALDMGLGKTPTVLAHLAGAAASGPALVIAPAAVVGNWAAEAARFTPGLRVVIHHGTSRASAVVARRRDRGSRRRHHHVRDRGPRHRRAGGGQLGHVRAGRGAGDQEPGERDGPAAAAHPGPHATRPHRHPDRERPRRPVGDPRLHQPGPRRHPSGVRRPAGRRRRERAAIAERAPRVPAHQARARGRRRAPRQDRRARPLHDDPRADRALPGRARRARRRRRRPPTPGASARRGRSSPRSPRSSRSATTRRPTATTACPSPVGPASSPGSRRSSRRCSPPASACSCSPTSRRGVAASPTTSARSRGRPIACYDGSLARGTRDRIVTEFQQGTGPGALVLSLKAGGTGLNLTAANHVVLYDRWWNPAVEDQARDRAWRIGQQRSVISHRLVCPGTIDERVEEVVAGKRHIAQLVLPRSSSIADLDVDQLRHRPRTAARRTAHGRRPAMNQPAKKRRPTRRTNSRRPATTVRPLGRSSRRCPTSSRCRRPTT